MTGLDNASMIQNMTKTLFIVTVTGGENVKSNEKDYNLFTKLSKRESNQWVKVNWIIEKLQKSLHLRTIKNNFNQLISAHFLIRHINCVDNKLRKNEHI